MEEEGRTAEAASHLLGDLGGRSVPSFLYQPLLSFLSSLDLSREFLADYGESARHPFVDVLRSCRTFGECILYRITRFGSICWTPNMLYASVAWDVLVIRMFKDSLRGRLRVWKVWKWQRYDISGKRELEQDLSGSRSFTKEMAFILTICVFLQNFLHYWEGLRYRRLNVVPLFRETKPSSL